jgi:two-component system nitrogen regulation sensor histidine kinase NtrY
LPRPHLTSVDVGTLARRVVGVETRMSVKLSPGPEITINADPDQLEQLLINLIKNAVEAASETGGDVAAGWRRTRGFLDFWVDDEGPGLSSTSNLFVPFFTTKPEGTGIGLVLSRQIAEAHGGALTLENRQAARGCRALLRLPL